MLCAKVFNQRFEFEIYFVFHLQLDLNEIIIRISWLLKHINPICNYITQNNNDILAHPSDIQTDHILLLCHKD